MDTLRKFFDGYYCLFKDDPTREKPYAVFASEGQALNMTKRAPQLSGPLTFREWLEEYTDDTAMHLKFTEHGYPYYRFRDRYDADCVIQKSSLATENVIWMGIEKAEAKIFVQGYGWIGYPLHEAVMINSLMHLTQEQVKEILPVLQRFAKTGEIQPCNQQEE